MNKNKVAAICAACIMIFGIIAAAEGENRDFGILRYLGIEIVSDSDKPVSRGEFTRNAVKLLNCESELSGMPPFWDVKEDNPYKNDIHIAYNAGIINGDSGEGFRTYENIKYIDALTELVRICGYEVTAEMNGGYPNGYLNTAGQLGISVSGRRMSDEISYRDMYELLILTLDADSYKDVFSQQDNDDDETVLSRYYNIKKVKGVVNADEYACLVGYTVCNENDIIVGDEYYYTDLKTDISGMLGLYAEAYYKEYDGEKTIVQINAATNRNSEINILSENLNGFSGGYLGYFENGRSKRIKISPDASVIYNGKNIDYSKDFNNSLFDISDGEITLIDNGNSGSCSVIKITEYQNIAVKYIDKENYILYDKFSSQIIDIDLEHNSRINLTISDSEGNPKQFSDIAREDILTVAESRDGEIVRIIISKNIENAFIKGVSRADKDTSVTTENGTYTLTDYAEKNPDIKLKTGKNAVLYINYVGKLVGISYDDSKRTKLAYILNVYMDSGDEIPVLKLLCENGEISDIHTAAAVKKDGVTIKANYSDTFNSDMKYQIIAYELNTEGKISKIDTSVYNPSLENDDSLFLRSRYEDTGSLAYKSPDRTFNGRASINEDTFMVEVPDDMSRYGDYRVLTYSDLTNTNVYNIDIYSFTNDSPLADGILIYSMETSIKPKDNEYLSMVKSVYTSLNDDEICLTLDIQRGDSLSTVYVTDEEIIPLLDGVEKGDIIRYGVNYKNEIVRFQWVYDYSEKQVKLEKNPTNSDFSSGSSRIIGAYVYMNDGGYIRIGNDMLNAGDENLETHLSSKVKQYTVDEDYEMKQIAQEEVRAYKDYGSGADYCLIQSYYGDIRTVIYIR